MLRLEIRQQQGQIAMQTQSPAIQLTTAPAKLHMETEAATVEINQPKGKLEIDGTPFRYSIGIKNSSDFSRDFAQEGHSAALEGIGRIAAEGDRMAAIETGEDVIAALAAESIYSEVPSITWASTSPPDIKYIAAPTQFEPKEGRIHYNNQQGSVDLKLNRGKVNISMAQYPSISIKVVGSRVNLNG